ncbi:hypothetical protein PGTUg99_001368 [Puccinia graminis f. sp. tritici]|uniref:Uncharacterized protein n=1 Tax=Puccinia graminis f. sp. tritici TaxID=56615 RepID=A0A5B0LUD7_PUCGR|nr:hypothetical protein PGTUg99_001368 [Puccinia graminis f. sp. tritici]
MKREAGEDVYIPAQDRPTWTTLSLENHHHHQPTPLVINNEPIQSNPITQPSLRPAPASRPSPSHPTTLSPISQEH